jgi:hypothetical protein
MAGFSFLPAPHVDAAIVEHLTLSVQQVATAPSANVLSRLASFHQLCDDEAPQAAAIPVVPLHLVVSSMQH